MFIYSFVILVSTCAWELPQEFISTIIAVSTTVAVTSNFCLGGERVCRCWPHYHSTEPCVKEKRAYGTRGGKQAGVVLWYQIGSVDRSEVES